MKSLKNTAYFRQTTSIWATILLLSLILTHPLLSQTQAPIHILFDLHVDPLPQVPLEEKQVFYDRQVENSHWVLDQMAPFNVQISFLSGGEFMEMLTLEGNASSGAEALRLIDALGGQIGSHSHAEYRLAESAWPSFGPNPTYADAIRSWQDNIDWVNAGIITALGEPLPQPIETINAVKGAHLPKTEADYHELMELFGLSVREGGPEEDYYGLYNHYIMNPYRPSADNYLQEDLDGPFVVSPQTSVIGKVGIHHGIFQDVSAPAAKRLFLQTYLNWRFRDRSGAPEKIWAFGWGSHTSDFNPGSDSRAALLETIQWLEIHFMHREESTGSNVANYSTHIASANAYRAWEQNNPGTSSFDSNGCCQDWNDYPYLRPVAEELWEARWVADLDLGPGLKAFHLNRPLYNVVVAWSDSSPQVRDLSTWIEGPCRIVGAETGHLLGTDCTAVILGAEPVLVTEAPATLIFVEDFEQGNVDRWSEVASGL